MESSPEPTTPDTGAGVDYPPTRGASVATRRRILVWFPVVLWCFALFFLSSRPQSSLPRIRLFPHQDKAVHFVLYLPLGFLGARALTRSRRDSGRNPMTTWMGATALAGTYGLSDEIHQLFTPGRAFDLWDLAADCVGGATGAWIWIQVERLVPGKGINGSSR